MAKILNTPNRTKHKFYHFRLSNKGNKGKYYENKEVMVLKVRSKKASLMTPGQLEVIRRMFAKTVTKSSGFMNIRCFPDLPMSKKPLGSRMGKGKGKFSSWKAGVKYGQNLVEFKYVRGNLKRKSLRMEQKRKIKLKKREKRKPLSYLVDEINSKVRYRLPIDTKIFCMFKRRQNYGKYWCFNNMDTLVRGIKDGVLKKTKNIYK